MKDAILRHVNKCSGIIAQKLLLDLMTEYGPHPLNVEEFNTTIEGLVKQGRIVRVQYVIPPNNVLSVKMRTGALYLPERSVVVTNQLFTKSGRQR